MVLRGSIFKIDRKEGMDAGYICEIFRLDLFRGIRAYILSPHLGVNDLHQHVSHRILDDAAGKTGVPTNFNHLRRRLLVSEKINI